LNFNGLSGVISQKTELFITTVVGTSNPTKGKAAPVSNYLSTIPEDVWGVEVKLHHS
jgi:hypothetical protein